MQFSTHGNNNGLNDLYILPENDQERELLINWAKRQEIYNTVNFYATISDVKGQSWYNRRFFVFVFGEAHAGIIAQACNIPFLQPGTFSIDGDSIFKGYHNPDNSWNGFNVPYFERQEAIRINDWLNSIPGNNDRIIIKGDEVTILEDGEKIMLLGVTTPTTEGFKTLYPIGSGWWVWTEEE